LKRVHSNPEYSPIHKSNGGLPTILLCSGGNFNIVDLDLWERLLGIWEDMGFTKREASLILLLPLTVGGPKIPVTLRYSSD
jgi:hypothetical protein